MGRYQFQEQEKAEQKEVHPAWRGIGCLLTLLIPAISYVGALVLLEMPSVARYVPRELYGRPTLPEFFWQYPVLDVISSGLYKLDDIGAKLFVAALLLMLISGIIAVVYAIMYRIIGPPRYSKPDVPPSRRKTKKYKR